jgi:hypothetical protein
MAEVRTTVCFVAIECALTEISAFSLQVHDREDLPALVRGLVRRLPRIPPVGVELLRSAAQWVLLRQRVALSNLDAICGAACFLTVAPAISSPWSAYNDASFQSMINLMGGGTISGVDTAYKHMQSSWPNFVSNVRMVFFLLVFGFLVCLFVFFLVFLLFMR